jgi:hypothetical protein
VPQPRPVFEKPPEAPVPQPRPVFEKPTEAPALQATKREDIPGPSREEVELEPPEPEKEYDLEGGEIDEDDIWE